MIHVKYINQRYFEQTDCSTELHYEFCISVMMKFFCFIVFVCKMTLFLGEHKLQAFKNEVVWKILTDSGDKVC